MSFRYVLATLHIAAIITDAGGHISVFPFLVTHAWRRYVLFGSIQLLKRP
jgi:hypothetical protein